MPQATPAGAVAGQNAAAHKSYTENQITTPSWALRLGVHVGLTLLALVPRAWFRSYARRRGAGLLYKRRRRHQVAKVNLDLCFPDASPEKRTELLDDFAKKLVFAGQDVLRLWWGSPRTLAKRVDIEGGHYLDAAQQNAQPVILLAPHTVGLEIGGLALATRYPMLGLASEAKCGFKNWAVSRMRGRFADCVANRAMPVCRVLSEVRAGRILYYLPDEDHGHLGRSTFVPFFGQSTCTLLGTGRMLALLNPVVLPCITLLDFKTGRYTVKIFAPVAGVTTNAKDNCALIRRELESLIRLQPADYLWTLQIFKNRVDSGVNSVYSGA